MNPKLDAALADGYVAWESALREIGLARATAWAVQRTGPEIPKEDLRDNLAALLEAAGDEDDLAVAQAELAELLEERDDELADLLWEQVLEHGMRTGDSDLIFEATSRLAGIAEDMGDPLAAAEYFIDFLNWRRRPENVSDPESVETAFDEIIRLAEIDGAPQEAAIFGYRQVRFTRVVETEGEAATTGDWEEDRAPYASWS